MCQMKFKKMNKHLAVNITLSIDKTFFDKGNNKITLVILVCNVGTPIYKYE